MIQNAKLHVLMTGTGSSALKAKVWTKNGCYSSLVPASGADIGNVKEVFSQIRHNFIGLDELDWEAFDDFTRQFSKDVDPKLTLALTLAVARASTDNDIWRLYGMKNMFPRIAPVVAKGSDWAEFMVIPYKENDIRDSFRKAAEVWRVMGEELKDHGVLMGRSQQGAWVTDMGDFELLHFIEQIAKDWEVKIGVNLDADRIWDGRNYVYKRSRSIAVDGVLSPTQQIDSINMFAEKYGVYYIEDPFQKGSFISYAHLTEKLRGKGIVAGNKLYESDMERIERGHKVRATSGIVFDGSNGGSLHGLKDMSDFAYKNGMDLVFSPPTAGTAEDPWMADLALAYGAKLLKTGISGLEATSRLNRLLEIWEEVPSPKLRKI